MANSSAPDGRYLPKKEKDMYDSLLGLYDKKEFKKGKKTAETILAKFPDHGETQAMKGLFVHTMGDTADGYDLVKKGLRNDVKSHVCWHALGLLHRTDNNYKEASKYYSNALRIDPENLNILRDLSFLQIQLRDLPGFLESRRRSIVIRPAARLNWIAFIAANYMMKQYDVAFDLIFKYRDAWKGENMDRYEESEILLYQNRCLEKQGLYEQALEHFTTFSSQLVDGLSVSTKRAELLVRLGRHEQAKPICISLLQQQPDNYRLHTLLQIAFLHVEGDLIDEMLALKHMALPSSHFVMNADQLVTLRALYSNQCVSAESKTYVIPESNASKRIALSLLDGVELETALDVYLRRQLHKNVPSLSGDICSMLLMLTPAGDRMQYVMDAVDFRSHPTIIMTMGLLDNYITSLKESSTFPTAATSSDAPVIELPTTYLWTLFLKCHLLEKSGRIVEALEVIEECVRHTPTAIDMHAKKAKLLKRSGDLVAAAAVMDQARELDLQDRYSNNKATKYHLRVDEMNTAMDTIAMFTKHDGSPQQILYDLQCSWYEAEAGESYERTRTWGMALKKYHAIQQHFTDYAEETFDFHGFCMRKSTLRAYTDILAVLDNVYVHNFFQRAARGAIRVYLRLLDGEPPVNNVRVVPPEPVVDEFGNVVPESETVSSVAEANPEENAKLAAMTPAERKKYKEQQKKRLKKKQKSKENKAAKANDEDEEESAKKAAAVVDKDPEGLTLLACSDPLGEATKWVTLLMKQESAVHLLEAETFALICEVNMRRHEYIDAAKALSTGFNIFPKHPTLTLMLTKLSLHIENITSSSAASGSSSSSALTLDQDTIATLQQQLVGLYDGHSTIIAYVNHYAEHHVDTVAQRVAAVKASIMCAPTIQTKQRMVAILSWDNILKSRGVNVKSLATALEVLVTECGSVDSDGVGVFKRSCAEMFPLSKAFGGPGYELKSLEQLFSIAPAGTA